MLWGWSEHFYGGRQFFFLVALKTAWQKNSYKFYWWQEIYLPRCICYVVIAWKSCAGQHFQIFCRESVTRKIPPPPSPPPRKVTVLQINQTLYAPDWLNCYRFCPPIDRLSYIAHISFIQYSLWDGFLPTNNLGSTVWSHSSLLHTSLLFGQLHIVIVQRGSYRDCVSSTLLLSHCFWYCSSFVTPSEVSCVITIRKLIIRKVQNTQDRRKTSSR